MLNYPSTELEQSWKKDWREKVRTPLTYPSINFKILTKNLQVQS